MDLTLPARIAVLGPGLIGGSLLLALRRRLPGAELRAWTRRAESVTELAALDPAIRASTDLAAAVANAGLVVLCCPVAAMPALAREIARTPPAPGCVVTDAGSVKAPVVTALEEIFANSNASFIGSHPMAGSERAGLGAARSDLFEGAACVLTPTLFTTEAALRTARQLWSLAGCRILEMPPEVHDRKVARISHLPHLAAAALTLAALRQDPAAAACAGNGFRDVTRIASGDPELWTGIIAANRAEILAALHDIRDVLAEFIAGVGQEDDRTLLHLLTEAKALRESALAS